MHIEKAPPIEINSFINSGVNSLNYTLYTHQTTSYITHRIQNRTIITVHITPTTPHSRNEYSYPKIAAAGSSYFHRRLIMTLESVWSSFDPASSKQIDLVVFIHQVLPLRFGHLHALKQIAINTNSKNYLMCSILHISLYTNFRLSLYFIDIEKLT